MNELPTSTTQAAKDDEPGAAVPWRQAGHPLIRVGLTADLVHPFVVEVGDHASLRVPMTIAAVSALRDALSALLAHTTPAQPEDFVTAWAEVHGATVRAGTSAGEGDAEIGGLSAGSSATYGMAA